MLKQGPYFRWDKHLFEISKVTRVECTLLFFFFFFFFLILAIHEGTKESYEYPKKSDEMQKKKFFFFLNIPFIWFDTILLILT